MPEEAIKTETQLQQSNVKTKVEQAGRIIRRYRKPYFVGLDGIIRTSFEDYATLTGRNGWGHNE